LIGISSLIVVTGLPILLLLFAVLGWAAWRFQQPGAAPAALLVSLFATWAVVDERGVFAGLMLSEKMFTLQMFNATVALTSFFFAAVVSERLRVRRKLEEAAAELEERVRHRTAELSTVNERLAEAQELAHLGSWDWNVGTGMVNWSPEMYRIHGVKPDAPITFERAIELAAPEDQARIRPTSLAHSRDGRRSSPTSSIGSFAQTAARGHSTGKCGPSDRRMDRSRGWWARWRT
jgi:PAS domain-containing protein